MTAMPGIQNMDEARSGNSAKFATRVIHHSGEREYEPTSGAVVPPITLSTTFAQEAPAKPISVQRVEVAPLFKSFYFRIMNIRVPEIPIGTCLKSLWQLWKTPNTVNNA